MTSHRRGRWNDQGGRRPAARGRVCLAPSVRAVFLVLLALLVLLFPTGAAAQFPEADFDGDGVYDPVFRGAHPEDLNVLLSQSLEPQRLQLPRDLVRFTTTDIDDDGDRDIVATTAGP